jgi:hypothetical protein
MPEARLPRVVLFRHASDVIDESAVRFIQLPQYVGERKAPFLFCYLRIEGAAHSFSSRFRSCCLSIVQVFTSLPLGSISHKAGAGYLILVPKLPPSEFIQNDLFLVKTAQIPSACTLDLSHNLCQNQPLKTNSM